MAYTTSTLVLNEAGLTAATGGASTDFVTTVIAEAADWIDTELGGVTTVPFVSVPATIGKIARFYAAGLLMSREYGLQTITEESTKEGERKLAQAEKWLADYRARLVSNSADTNSIDAPRGTEDKRIFEEYDTTNSRWDVPTSYPFRANREL